MELEKNSLVSMYSNWNVVAKDSHPPRLSPRDGMSCYNSTHNSTNHAMFTTLALNKYTEEQVDNALNLSNNF